MRKLSVALAFLALAAPAYAQTAASPPVLVTKAPVAAALNLAIYPSSRCGIFYGVGMYGGAAGVTGAPGGTVQLGGAIEGLIGYACPTAALPWFVQLELGGQNFNAGNGIFAISAPATIKGEVAVQTPLIAFIQSWSGASSATSPTTWLPPGYSVNGAPVSYLGFTTTFNDVSSTYGVGSFHDWVWTPIGARLGALWNISGPNGKALVADTYVEVDVQSNNVCFGALAAVSCVRTGTLVTGGIEIKL
jgi:hypothetical protein